MKTLMFAPMWLDQENRLERNVKWIRFYKENDIFNKLGVHGILFVDNASSQENLDVIRKEIPEAIIHRCDEFLPRKSHLEYPYWYRAFGIAGEYSKANGYDKIIHVDTDVFILSNKICEYIKGLNTGWNTFFCNKHNFPESTFQIIGKDSIDVMTKWMTKDYLVHYPCDAELVIPWTNVNKDFLGDRYGETSEKQHPLIDFYAQCPNEVHLRFIEKN